MSSLLRPDLSITSLEALAIALIPPLKISCPSNVQVTLAASSSLNLSIADPKLGISNISNLSELIPLTNE